MFWKIITLLTIGNCNNYFLTFAIAKSEILNQFEQDQNFAVNFWKYRKRKSTKYTVSEWKQSCIPRNVAEVVLTQARKHYMLSLSPMVAIWKDGRVSTEIASLSENARSPFCVCLYTRHGYFKITTSRLDLRRIAVGRFRRFSRRRQRITDGRAARKSAAVHLPNAESARVGHGPTAAAAAFWHFDLLPLKLLGLFAHLLLGLALLGLPDCLLANV